ncbi:hypothetical protein [Roseomonas indoligenes]|uniref:Uncharacterized protein n=1 Tax=Roseomonas indoligenes TaxID=2820811 RepID=A0A940S6M1_9PROT|nr:hypothetical protein [Pararoseomonas indoligenes]MBP0492192.1 hypothetical protein [Pararoseomonas indoligenes]
MRPQHRTRGKHPSTSGKTWDDIHQINRAADLLTRGATAEERSSGMVCLQLDGKFAMYTNPRTLKAAQEQLQVGETLGRGRP